ncbi:hypothetical protein [Lentilactobacillus kisonensis]|uniref:Uncharacterized protein n=2 Tax=Lentilactobacillus kisonensis TaxID=481722 RepID=H1LC61_9LACO|nr:hypothetical protein [Lentilactobacillus kisonensis]EHO54282.1 hypothetical protein HMPREF9104_00174 [Lentilactobacillus kisonensis F0435]KRL20740.1 hypothetical protein FC98_GL001330 [Lentilactobacillus kisonensis DSM 19906 = JCM 15041]
MLTTILTNIGLVLGLVIGVPFLFILLLSLINRNTKQHIATRFGINGQLYFGFLGIMIHEASHLITALLFGHKINQFRLIKFPSSENPTLGYVHHTWHQRNIYQNMGNLFIGIAPIFGCCGAILLACRWLLPNGYELVVTLADQTTSAPITIPDFNWPGLLIFIVIAANICIGGFDLSTADFQNAKQGLWQAVVLLIIVALISSFLPIRTSLFGWLIQLTIILSVISGFNLVISLLFNGFFRLI